MWPAGGWGFAQAKRQSAGPLPAGSPAGAALSSAAAAAPEAPAGGGGAGGIGRSISEPLFAGLRAALR